MHLLVCREKGRTIAVQIATASRPLEGLLALAHVPAWCAANPLPMIRLARKQWDLRPIGTLSLLVYSHSGGTHR